MYSCLLIRIIKTCIFCFRNFIVILFFVLVPNSSISETVRKQSSMSNGWKREDASLSKPDFVKARHEHSLTYHISHHNRPIKIVFTLFWWVYLWFQLLLPLLVFSLESKIQFGLISSHNVRVEKSSLTGFYLNLVLANIIWQPFNLQSSIFFFCFRNFIVLFFRSSSQFVNLGNSTQAVINVKMLNTWTRFCVSTGFRQSTLCTIIDMSKIASQSTALGFHSFCFCVDNLTEIHD